MLWGTLWAQVWGTADRCKCGSQPEWDMAYRQTTEAMVACAVQRFKAGEKKPYEEFAALYSAVNIDGKWMIRDMWAFDDLAKPPTSVPLADFKKC